MKKADRPILIVIGNNKNGGIARHAASLANGFSDLGRDATIIITKDNSDNSFFPLKERARIVCVNDISEDDKEYKKAVKKTTLRIKTLKLAARFIPAESTAGFRMRYAVSKYRKNVALSHLIGSFHDPIVIALGFEYAINAFYASKGTKCDLLYGTRTYKNGEVSGIPEKIVRSVLEKCSCVVSQTGFTANEFRTLGAKNVEVIGNPLFINTPPYRGERNHTIVNFCRVSREKRLDLLIEAFSDICSEHPEYKIEIYGTIVTDENEKHKQELLDLIKKLGLVDRVSILPARKDIHETVRNCAMFVSTSDFEGLSNSMIEAMALGMPCICIDCDGGGAREMITDGKNGLLIPKNDRQALAEAMLKFINDKALADKCGENAAKIREELSADVIVRKWLDLYEKYCD